MRKREAMKKIFLAIQIFMVILLAGCGRIEERPPQIVKISAGGDHSAVLLEDGSVIACFLGKGKDRPETGAVLPVKPVCLSDYLLLLCQNGLQQFGHLCAVHIAIRIEHCGLVYYSCLSEQGQRVLSPNGRFICIDKVFERLSA